MTDTVIEVQDLARTYHAGDVDVHALRGVNLRDRARRIRRHHGLVRLRQVDDDGDSRLPRSADRAAAICSKASTSRSSRSRNSRASAANASASCFRASICSRAPARSRIRRCRCSIPSDVPPAARASGRSARAHALELLGLGQRAGNTPAQFSGGEQQRVAIARALINAPSVLLADEPTGNLDTKNSHEIMQTLVRFNREQRVTVVVVTHESDIAAYADRVITMRDGGVVSDERRDSFTGADQTPAPRQSPRSTTVRQPTGHVRGAAARHRRGIRADDRRRGAAGARAQQDALGADDARCVHRRRCVDRDGGCRSRRQRSGAQTDREPRHEHVRRGARCVVERRRARRVRQRIDADRRRRRSDPPRSRRRSRRSAT